MKLAYIDHGRGAPVFLVHGFPLDHSIWMPVVDAFSGDARFILPDLRGHGASPATQGAYPMSEMAGDLVELADDLGISSAIWVGHSMGGYVSLALAARHSARVAGLGLIASHPFEDPPEKRQGRLVSARAVLTAERDKVFQGLVSALSDDEGVRQRSLTIMQGTDSLGVAGALLGMADRPDTSSVLSALDAPVLMLAGESDRILPLENARQAFASVRHGLWRQLPGVGHMPMLEAPKMVAAAIQDLVVAAAPKV